MKEKCRRMPLAASALLLASMFLMVVYPRMGTALAQDAPCYLCELVGGFDRSRLEEDIRKLSGADTVLIGGLPYVIATRYAASPQKLLAMEYLLERIRSEGYDPRVQTFPLTVNYPDLLGIAVTSAGDTVWTASSEGEIFRRVSSVNSGPFELCTMIDARVWDLGLDPRGRLWAAGKKKGSSYGMLFYSDDAGDSWNLFKEGNSDNLIYSLMDIEFWDGEFAVAAGSYGTLFLMRYIVNEWWIIHVDRAKLNYLGCNGVAMTGPDHVWVVTDGGYLFETKDSGFSWSSTSLTSAVLSGIDFADPNHGVIVGDNSVFYTSNGGADWGEVVIGDELRSVEMIDSSLVYSAGEGGNVWKSENGGASWDSIGTACTGTTDIWRLTSDENLSVWAAGGNEVLKIDTDGGEPPECSITVFADTLLGKNIIFSLEGRDEPDHRIVLCGHYDSQNWHDPLVSAPGADDNGSGTACVLECARLLQGAWVSKTVEFFLFDGEELGLKGSQYYVGHRDTNITYDAVINIDMVGNDYGGRGEIDISGRIDGIDTLLVVDVAASFAYFGLQNLPNRLARPYPASDHMAFWEIEGVPAVLLIESGYRDNPHYHSSSDVVEYVDFDYVAEAGKAALGTAAILAGYLPSAPDTNIAEVVLHQNYPNPLFNHTRIRFELPGAMPIKLSLYDVTGRRVALLIDDVVGPGKIEFAWNGKGDSGEDLASGIYFLRLDAGGCTRSRKVVILR